jgi:hypothetical protein
VGGAETFELGQRIAAAGVRGVHVDEVAVGAPVAQSADFQSDRIVEREDRADA